MSAPRIGSLCSGYGGLDMAVAEVYGGETVWVSDIDKGANKIWDKGQARLGYWFRGQHEHLLVGVKGNWSPPPVHLRTSSIYSEPSGRHSKKPDEIRNRIATWWPDARRLEMFCRYPSPGWHVWGNQVDSTLSGLPFERFDPHVDPAQDSLFGGVA